MRRLVHSEKYLLAALIIGCTVAVIIIGLANWLGKLAIQ